MVANAGDVQEGEETRDEETRTVRLVEPTVDDLSQEDIQMDINMDRHEEAEEREGAMGRGRGRFMDD